MINYFSEYYSTREHMNNNQRKNKIWRELIFGKQMKLEILSSLQNFNETGKKELKDIILIKTECSNVILGEENDYSKTMNRLEELMNQD